MMKKRLDKPRIGHVPNKKLKSLTNLPFAFPVRDPHASSFGSTVNITVSHPRVNEFSTRDFHQTTSSKTATFNARNDPVVPMSERGTCVLVTAKEGTGANTARTPDTETKVEGMKTDNEFSDLSEDYKVQEFEFEKGNNYPSVKGRIKKNLIFWQETLSTNSTVLDIIDNVTRFPSLKHLNVLHFAIINQL